MENTSRQVWIGCYVVTCGFLRRLFLSYSISTVLAYIVHTSNHDFAYIRGRLVDDPEHVDYVPNVFVYNPVMAEAVYRQKNE